MENSVWFHGILEISLFARAPWRLEMANCSSCLSTSCEMPDGMTSCSAEARGNEEWNFSAQLHMDVVVWYLALWLVRAAKGKVKAAEAYLTVHSGYRSVGFKIAEYHNPHSLFSHENPICSIIFILIFIADPSCRSTRSYWNRQLISLWTEQKWN